MRHRVKGKKLGRSTGHRQSLETNLLSSIIRHERIETTQAKAQFIRGSVERLITKAKRGLVLAEQTPERGVHARRLAAARLNNDRELVGKLFDTLAPRYAARPGGYTRIIKLGPRKGDAAEMVLLELVDRDTSS
jgi:large subunit ribosomal protein L17